MVIWIMLEMLNPSGNWMLLVNQVIAIAYVLTSMDKL
jgi:hypothetical protein